MIDVATRAVWIAVYIFGVGVVVALASVPVASVLERVLDRWQSQARRGPASRDRLSDVAFGPPDTDPPFWRIRHGCEWILDRAYLIWVDGWTSGLSSLHAGRWPRCRCIACRRDNGRGWRRPPRRVRWSRALAHRGRDLLSRGDR